MVKVDYAIEGDVLGVITRVQGGDISEDLLIVAAGSAVMKVLEPLSDGFASISFPSKYLIRSAEVGESRTMRNGDDFVITTALDLGKIREACRKHVEVGDLAEELRREIHEAMEDIVSGFVARHVMNYGNHLRNLGEEVEIMLRDGKVVSGEVMGFGRGGELVVAAGGELVAVKPSQVKSFKTVWP